MSQEAPETKSPIENAIDNLSPELRENPNFEALLAVIEAYSRPTITLPEELAA